MKKLVKLVWFVVVIAMFCWLAGSFATANAGYVSPFSCVNPATGGACDLVFVPVARNFEYCDMAVWPLPAYCNPNP